MLATLFAAMLMAPAVVLLVGTALRPDDRTTGEALLRIAACWYAGLFAIAGIVYIFDTLTTINSYGG